MTGLVDHFHAIRPLADELGWDFSIGEAEGDLRVFCAVEPRNAIRFAAGLDQSPVWHGTHEAVARHAPPNPADIAICDVLSALGVSEADTVVFPNADDESGANGPIDALKLTDTCTLRWTPGGPSWTREDVMAPLTRYNIVRIAFESGLDRQEMRKRLMADRRIYLPPDWTGPLDTAQVAELVRDLGPRAGHKTIVFAQSRSNTPRSGARQRHTFWLAADERVLSGNLLDAIGALVNPGLPSAKRREMVSDLIERSPERPAPIKSGMRARTRVGLVGLGTIGKRVARAITGQPDMCLMGVCLPNPNTNLVGLEAAVPELFHLGDETDFRRAGFSVRGDLEDLLRHCDVVVDCGPRGSAANRAAIYNRCGVRVVYQGGENSDIADSSFCASANFQAAQRRKSVRVASCNTTGLVRIISALRTIAEPERLRASLIRCATDTDKAEKGAPNALVAHLGLSHHSADVREFFPWLDIQTLAIHAPTNHAHLINMFFRFRSAVSTDAVRSALGAARRVVLFRGGNGSTSELRPSLSTDAHQDLFSAVVWDASLRAQGKELSLSVAVHMEAIVIPDTIDAIRALAGAESDAATSMNLTDQALDIRWGQIPLQAEEV